MSVIGSRTAVGQLRRAKTFVTRQDGRDEKLGLSLFVFGSGGPPRLKVEASSAGGRLVERCLSWFKFHCTPSTSTPFLLTSAGLDLRRDRNACRAFDRSPRTRSRDFPSSRERVRLLDNLALSNLGRIGLLTLMRHRIIAILFVALLVGSAGFSRFAWAGKTTVPQRDRNRENDSSKIRLGVGLIRTGSGNWGTLTNTNKYSILITSSGNAKHAARQPGLALTWGCGVTIPSASWAARCGVTWDDAVAKNWILEDATGKHVPYGDHSYLADIGNPKFQQHWIADIDADIRAHPGIDGVFIDNVVGSLIARSVSYPDSASYRAAMLSFIRAVGPALRRKGWYVTVNASIYDPGAQSLTGQSYDGTQFIWWVKQIAPYVDGINLEHWQQNWDSTHSVRLTGLAGNQAWDGWERVPTAVQRLGKDFYAMDRGSLADVQKAKYLKASFLLAWTRRQGAFLYTDSYAGTADPWNPAWMFDLGRPAGVKHRVGVGWRRTFTKGAVIVNPDSSASQTFTFRRTYLTPDGTGTRVVTLPPASGLLLRTRKLR